MSSDPSGKLSHHEDFDDEAAFLAAYKAQDYPRPSVTVDLVIFTVLDGDLKVLLIERGGHPFKGWWALPGGFVNVGDGVKDQGEDVEDAAHRELEEETHLPKGSCHLEQLYTFGKAYRDPRTRVIDVAYLALVRPTLAPLVTAGDDAAATRWVSVQTLWDNSDTQRLAFDHREILTMAIERVRGKIDYSPIAFDLVPEAFSVAELRSVYEAVKGTTYNARNFNRRFKRMLADGVIETTVGHRPNPSGGPRAHLYQFKRAA